MRHLTAVHIDGGWRYASLGRRGGGPIGNCAGHLHDTELEARECYAAYLREQVRLDRGNLRSWSGCKVEGCDRPTKNAAKVSGDYGLAPLCDEHLTHEVACEVLGLNRPAGDSWQS